MSSGNLEDFVAYRKSLELFDFVVEDMKSYIQSRGSLRETRGRYRRFRHWMPHELVKSRMALAEEINRMLSATIKTLER